MYKVTVEIAGEEVDVILNADDVVDAQNKVLVSVVKTIIIKEAIRIDGGECKKMSEIKRKIVNIHAKYPNGKDVIGFLVKEEHTIADIARWVIKEDWNEELLYFLRHPEDL